MASVNFLYRSTKPYGKLTARLLYRHMDQDFQYDSPTDIYVEKPFWDIYKTSKRLREAHLIEKKTIIEAKTSDLVVHVLNKFTKENTANINKDWFKAIIDEYFNPSQRETLPTDLLKYFLFYLDLKKDEVENSTYKRYRTVYRLLQNFYKDSKVTSLALSAVNLEFQRKFESYCKQKNYSPNTIGKSIKVIKSTCKHALVNGMEISHQLDSIKIKKQAVTSIYLNEEELGRIKKIKLSGVLNDARDWLLVSCFSGQRISDFKKFRASNIIKREGIEIIEIMQKKSKSPVIIPIHPELKKILLYRGGEFPPQMRDNDYNRFIKKVCEQAEINEPIYGKVKISDGGQQRGISGMYKKHELITSHVGRKSFATNFYGKISTPLIMSATGHKTEQTFLMYIGKTQSHLSIELGKLFK